MCALAMRAACSFSIGRRNKTPVARRHDAERDCQKEGGRVQYRRTLLTRTDENSRYFSLWYGADGPVGLSAFLSGNPVGKHLARDGG